MPRPKKLRHCEGTICDRVFKPAGTPLRELRQIPLGHDELEAFRLCDKENLTQAEAGERMGVSRGTVQRLLSLARSKVATALSEGAALVFESSAAEGSEKNKTG